MTLIEKAVWDSLSMVDYNYGVLGQIIIDNDNLHALVENVVLAAIYNKDILEEVYKKNN